MSCTTVTRFSASYSSVYVPAPLVAVSWLPLASKLYVSVAVGVPLASRQIWVVLRLTAS
jgi:hypothetical protein